MPSYKFTDQESQSFELLPPGEYRYEIVGADFGIQAGGKTAGSDFMEVKAAIYADAEFTQRKTTVRENMIFHPSCLWKIDTFVKCSNLLVDGKPPVKGQDIEFTPHRVVGLRGWCVLKVEEYKNAAGETKKVNRVATWLTNKEKIARKSPVADVATDTDADGKPLPF